MELFAYLTDAMATAGKSLKLSQTPELFVPGDRSVRLTEDAKTAIRKLAADLDDDQARLQDIDEDYAAATQAADQEVEPRLLYGLLLLKKQAAGCGDKAF